MDDEITPNKHYSGILFLMFRNGDDEKVASTVYKE
jgi:hypothetical protein